MPDSGSLLRLGVFAGLWCVLALAEARWPARHDGIARLQRWPANFGLVLLDTVTLRVLLPWLAIDAALYADAHHIGLLQVLPLPDWANWIIALFALDLVIYWQHRLLHRVPVLWRMHRVHHSDLTLDASSGVRFHPLEIVFSMGIKISAVLILGAPAAAVLVFEIVLNGFSLFTHSNLRMPSLVDRAMRWVFVTPAMHRVHHSVLRAEHDRNFCFHVSWWDRLFRTYLDRATSPLLGLHEFRAPRQQRLLALLAQPMHAVSAARPERD